MKYTIIRPKDHEGWLAERSKGIGSSEAGTIMGCNHFDTRYKLWRRKRGIDGPVPENEAMELGHHMEDAVATMFAARTGAYIVRSSKGDWLAVDNEKPYFRVSPDRLYYYPGEKHVRSCQHILECKTSSTFIDRDDIPSYWYCQIQYQMGVMRVRKGAIAWICSKPKLTFDYVEVDFNPAFFSVLIETIDHFWRINVKSGECPEMEDAQDTLLRWPQAETESRIKADAELMGNYTKLKQVGTQLKELETEKKSLEDVIKTAMGPAETLTDPDGKILAQWKNTKDTDKFNAKAFLETDPERYAQYVVTVPGSRRFVLK